MRDKILEILKENWHGSYNDCADDLLGLFSVSKSFYCQRGEGVGIEDCDTQCEYCKED